MVERQPLLFPENAGVSGILVDKEIQDAIERNWLISKETFQQSSLEASSYDIRVGTKGVIGGDGVEIDLRKDAMELGPGAYGGIISYEKLWLPDNVCARIGSKRALSYEGVILLTGTTVDPGYEGHLLFGVYNASQRKVLIRFNKKLCNIVFERLGKPPERLAPSDPSLKVGNFPDAFLDRMANMEVFPWMQISERVKQIETITKDILDLKARYDDVLQPISMRLGDNDFAMVRSSPWSKGKRPNDIAEDVSRHMDPEIALLGRERIPLSISLLQFVFGALCKDGVIAVPLDRYCPLITPELEILYPVKAFKLRFDFST